MKVVFAALKFDYGIEARGESLEYKSFYPALKSNFEVVAPFWLEENGYPDDKPSLQKRLLQFAEDENPDYIFFILMEYEIFKETLSVLKNRYLTINWFCDDAWRYDNYSKYAAEYFTYCITVDKYSVLKYHKSGYKNVILSQWATFDYVEDIDFNKTNYKYEVSFIGTKNPTRDWIINHLKRNNVHVECFGAGWNNGKVSYDRSKEIYLNSKINLNLSNSVSNDIRFLRYSFARLLKTFLKIPFQKPVISIRNLKFYLSSIKYFFYGQKRVETLKARNFEIPGCGGFQLSQYALEIEDYYKIGEEISIFSNIDDLVIQINYYLIFSDLRENIRNCGYKRTRDHTYNIRISKVLNSLRQGAI